MKNRVLRISIIVLIISINIGCDQSTKHLAKKFVKDNGVIHVIDSFFILEYAENNGAFLSIFSSLPATVRTISLVILPSLLLIVFLIWIIKTDKIKSEYLFFSCCILGGGISNILDRLTNNEYVIDFMNFGIGSFRTGILNFADLSITFGVLALIYISYKNEKRILNNCE